MIHPTVRARKASSKRRVYLTVWRRLWTHTHSLALTSLIITRWLFGWKSLVGFQRTKCDTHNSQSHGVSKWFAILYSAASWSQSAYIIPETLTGGAVLYSCMFYIRKISGKFGTEGRLYIKICLSVWSVSVHCNLKTKSELIKVIFVLKHQAMKL